MMDVSMMKMIRFTTLDLQQQYDEYSLVIPNIRMESSLFSRTELQGIQEVGIITYLDKNFDVLYLLVFQTLSEYF